MTTVGGDGEDGSFPAWPRLSRDSRGRFYGITPARQSVPFLYDSVGNFLQELGRTGEGPGEYWRPMAIVVGVADTVYVVDGNRRLSTLAPDYTLVATAQLGQLPWVYNAIMALGSHLVFDGQRNFDPPISVYDLSGNQVLRFGHAQRSCRGCGRPAYVLGLAHDSTLWTAQVFYDYRIDRWDRTGALLDSVLLTSDWFVPYDSLRSLTPEREPWAAVSGIWEDDRGLLWILGRAADSEWAKGLGKARAGEAGVRYHPIEDLAQVFDGVIEIVDPHDGSIIARRRLDKQPWLLPIEPGLIASLRESTDGWWLVDVYETQLVGPDY